MLNLFFQVGIELIPLKIKDLSDLKQLYKWMLAFLAFLAFSLIIYASA
jgi:hypothetical protein